MKIIIPAVEAGDFETAIHDNFGRAAYFALIDSEKESIEFIENTASSQSSGAGVGAAQICADKNADVVAAYHFGPKAFQALKAAKIEVLDLNKQKIIREAYNDYQADKLDKAEAGAGGHH